MESMLGLREAAGAVVDRSLDLEVIRIGDAGGRRDQIKERGFPGAGLLRAEPTKAGGESAAKEGAIERRKRRFEGVWRMKSELERC